MTPSEAREVLASVEPVGPNAFGILQTISSLLSEGPNLQSQELTLRSLSRREEFNGCSQILWELTRAHGLFPYLEEEDLDFQQRLALEYHRPGKLGERGLVFHGPQARVFELLMKGESVILSAPTSFGKSLVIDALLLNERYDNVLVVVPTIALIDETRRRLSRLDAPHKVITHLGQAAAEKNVYVMTQERVVEIVDEINVDFFVIDEFYKLSPSASGEDSRAAILNQVFYRLVRRRLPFYMLGPAIRSVPPGLESRVECRFLYHPYHTVVSELHNVPVGDDPFSSLAQLCRELHGPTMIYCRSPRRAAEVAAYLRSSLERSPLTNLNSAVDWIGRTYHEDWHLTRAIEVGIGVHHGRLPRSLAQYVVRSFDEGDLDLLICTSTLIEGVNTKARNIVIFDNTINQSRFDFFTFNNIRGRSGRMFQHFVGHVYLFHDPPVEELPFVDVPSFTNSAEASDGLLLQMDDDDLSSDSKERTQVYHDQTILSIETLKSNSGVDPEIQLQMAEYLIDCTEDEARLAAGWQGYPRYEELLATCNLIWATTQPTRLGSGSVRSARQLAFRINELRGKPSIRSLIDQQLEFLKGRNVEAQADEAVQNVLDFIRLWAQFHFPRLLSALDRVQAEVLPKRGVTPGRLSSYASQVEGLFLGGHVVAIEEYGLPIQTGMAMGLESLGSDDFDDTLRYIRDVDPSTLEIDGFEAALLADVKASIAI